MRDLIVTQNITVDGVVEAGDWFGPGDGGPDLLEVLNEQASRADGFLTGRLTFRRCAGSGRSRPTTRPGSPRI
jgi:hypothetical protein